MTPEEIRAELAEADMSAQDLRSLCGLLRQTCKTTTLAQERKFAELEAASVAQVLDALDGSKVETEDLGVSWAVTRGLWNALGHPDELTPRLETCREHPKTLAVLRRRAHGFVAYRCLECRRLLDLRAVSPPEAADRFAYDLEGVSP